MIVLDASAVVEVLIESPLGRAVARELAEHADIVMAPHLLDVEVASALRSLAAARDIDSHRVQEYLDALASLPADRCSHVPLLTRMWELRHNFTSYDAAYIALAESMNAILYTCDSKLLKGHRAKVVLFTEALRVDNPSSADIA